MLNIAPATTMKNIFIEGFGVSSATIQPNQLFFALKGKKVDGHSFLKEVKERGASAAIVDKNYHGDDFGLPLLFVDDVLLSLQTLAKQLALNKEIIAITGSVGKTTTKEFLFHLLEKKYSVGKTIGSYNGQIGLPLTILNMEDNKNIWVLEMGISEPNEMDRLLTIIYPKTAIITKITHCHVANFKNGIDDIIEEKIKILKTARLAIIPASLIEKAKTYNNNLISYSLEDEKADFFLKKQKNNQAIIFEKGKKSATFTINIEEIHFWENILSAIAVSRHYGLSYDQIAVNLSTLSLPKMRCEKIQKHNALFINDAYNANPASMQAALNSLLNYKNNKKIAVLGAMKELGSFSDNAHINVVKQALTCADIILLIGEEYLSTQSLWEKDKIIYFDNLNTLAITLANLIQPKNVILLKASRSVGLEKILDLMSTTPV
jgi:UDP-N-acetylmuramoyl-tripeptide--D-alanyl-D-alanine ligase